MASKYLQITDFSGLTKTAKDIYTKNDLQEYIEKFEVRYLQELLGCDLYAAFAVDFAILTTIPTDAKFLEIWNPIAKDNACGIIRSEGIRKMLVYFIYWEYLRDQPIKNNIAGNTKNVQANSVPADSRETNVFDNYNKGIESYNAIQWMILENPNNYDWTLFNGQVKDIAGII